MIVEEVKIILKGRCSLSRLRILGYRKYRDVYSFTGVMHKYTFKRIDSNTVEILIRAKDKYHELYHEVTFAQIQDWVGRSVRAIQGNRK